MPCILLKTHKEAPSRILVPVTATKIQRSSLNRPPIDDIGTRHGALGRVRSRHPKASARGCGPRPGSRQTRSDPRASAPACLSLMTPAAAARTGDIRARSKTDSDPVAVTVRASATGVGSLGVPA